ncbi:response regulator transcription factor [Methylobacterium nigriterrae]|uniref:response regulator transcription factor n=1 Tax=Methylobacterium nigriterrae TaxID=3127512 RepID=UPI003013EBDD
MRVLIADEHDIVRMGVRALLANSPDHEICGEAADGGTTIAMAQALTPEIAIIGCSLERFGDECVTRRVLDISPRTKVILLGSHFDEGLIDDFLLAGARGYILKSEVCDHMLPALTALAYGKPYFSNSVASLLIEDRVSHPHRRRPLTTRERQVVRLLAKALSVKNIASQLSLSSKTVESHRASAMQKLNVTNVAGLTRCAIRRRLADL